MKFNQSIPMEIEPQQALPDEKVEQMDAATQELSSFIKYLCDKYGAEFIVQKVIFTFVPRMDLPLQEEKEQ